MVSRSSTKAEYGSMVVTCCELKWLWYLLWDLWVPQPLLIPLYCDNQAALHISFNPVFHEQTKHIEIDYHFIRDEIQAPQIAHDYIPMDAQPSDTFTKALGQSYFQSLLYKLGIRNLHAPLWGGMLGILSYWEYSYMFNMALIVNMYTW